MYRTRLLFVLILILILCSMTQLFAQGGGRISGKVSDKETGESLPGANVLIEGTSIGSATDLEGEYVIPKVPAGSYVLVVTYIGYSEMKVPVNVSVEDVVQNIQMEFETIEGQTVEVTAQAEGQMAAINQQISAITIKNVVAADRIEKIPDANAAESVARLPGISLIRSGGEGQQVAVRGLSPQYNVMMVNGVRMQSTDRDNRAVDLNMISPNVLSGIEVTKALTADMDADAVGGTVNLVVGKAPEGFQGRVSAQGGYGEIANTFGNYRFNGVVSNRYFDNKFGVRLSGSIDKFNRNSDILSAGYAVNEETQREQGLAVLDLTSVVIRDRVTDRRRVGGGLILDYDLPDGSLILNNFISNLSEEQIEMQNSFGIVGSSFGAFGAARELSNTVISNALQGEYRFGPLKADFSLSNSISKQDRPGDLRMNIAPEQGQIGFSTTVAENATPGEFLQDVTVFDVLRATRIFTVKRDIQETAREAVLNFSLPYSFTNDIAGNFKVGGKYIYNKRDNDETELFNQPDRTFQGERFVAAMRESLWTDLGLLPIDENLGIRASLFEDSNYNIGDNYLNGEVGLNRFFYTPDIAKMNRFETLAVDNNAYFVSEQQSFERDFVYRRDFTAFYAMTDLNLGKYITIFPGVRYEKFDIDYTAFSINKFGPNFEDFNSEELTTKTTGKNWFPQMQVRLKPTSWFDLRLASTESIIYPDYRAISPFIHYNTYSNPQFVVLGNPDLKPAIAQNYDIYGSVYNNHIGLFTAGYFYKEIDDLMVPFEFKTTDSEKINNRLILPTTANTNINTWINLNETSTVKGFELDWQTNFWYLPSFLRGLVFNINYTHITSETTFPFQIAVKQGTGIFAPVVLVDSTRVGRMPDQANDVLNATLGYDYRGFSARLSFLYQDNVLGTAGTRDELDSYTGAFIRWDLILYQNLPWTGLRLFANLNNISNRPDRQFVSVLEKLSSEISTADRRILVSGMISKSRSAKISLLIALRTLR